MATTTPDRRPLKRILTTAVLTVLILGLCYGAALLLGLAYSLTLSDALFWEGLLVVALAIIPAMRGDPSYWNLLGLRQSLPHNPASAPMEKTALEREIDRDQPGRGSPRIVGIGRPGTTLLIAGVLVLLASALLA